RDVLISSWRVNSILGVISSPVRSISTVAASPYLCRRGFNERRHQCVPSLRSYACSNSWATPLLKHSLTFSRSSRHAYLGTVASNGTGKRRATAVRPPVIWKKPSLQADTTILPSQSRSMMATLVATSLINSCILLDHSVILCPPIDVYANLWMNLRSTHNPFKKLL